MASSDTVQFFATVGFVACLVIGFALFGFGMPWMFETVCKVREYHEGEYQRERADRHADEAQKLTIELDALKKIRSQETEYR